MTSAQICAFICHLLRAARSGLSCRARRVKKSAHTCKQHARVPPSSLARSISPDHTLTQISAASSLCRARAAVWFRSRTAKRRRRVDVQIASRLRVRQMPNLCKMHAPSHCGVRWLRSPANLRPACSRSFSRSLARPPSARSPATRRTSFAPSTRRIASRDRSARW